MLGKKKYIVDEMDDSFVDEMDVDSIDETRKFGEKGYFGDEDYKGGESHDHLCKTEHDHIGLDKSFKDRYNYYDDVYSERKSDRLERKLAVESEGEHLCEEEDHHEHKKTVRTAEVASYTDYPGGGTPEVQESFYPDGETADADLGMKISEIGIENGSLPENTVKNTREEKEAMAKVAAMIYEKEAKRYSPLTEMYRPGHDEPKDGKKSLATDEDISTYRSIFIILAVFWFMVILVSPLMGLIILHFGLGIIRRLVGTDESAGIHDKLFSKGRMKLYRFIGLLIGIVAFIFHFMLTVDITIN